MVTTRSQTRAAASAANTDVNAKVRKTAQFFVIPSQKLENARAQVINTKVQPKVEVAVTPVTSSVNQSMNRVMTRSMTRRRSVKSAKIETWNTYTEQVLDQLKNNKTSDGIAYTKSDRQKIWVNWIKYFLNELEETSGVEQKTICATNMYKILSHMFQYHFMDFASSDSLKKYWDTCFAKEKELLADLDKHYKHKKLTMETYTECKKYVQKAQTFQIMFETLVFPERAGFSMKTPTLF
jgi:hypothetical protein